MTPAHDDELRKECEQWIEKTDGADYCLLEPLLRLCRQQRATVWREARDRSEAVSREFGSQTTIGISHHAIAELCESKAKELEGR